MDCYICKSSDLLEAPDYQWCRDCHTVKSNCRYDPAIYNGDYAFRYFKFRGTAIANELATYRLKLAMEWCGPSRKILDVGCGTGEFLHCASRDFDCYGLDPNPAANFLTYKHLQPKILGSLDGNRGFGLITLFDVFEHFPDPVSTFLDLKRRLAPSGAIVMVTPNIEAVPFGDVYALEQWKHFKVREHLYLFGLDSFAHLARLTGTSVAAFSYGESKIRPGNPNDDLVTVIMKRSGE